MTYSLDTGLSTFHKSITISITCTGTDWGGEL